MKARVESARSTVNQHVRLSLALLGLALVVLVIFVPGSGANLTGSTFEGSDGNMLVDTGGNTDWVTYKTTATKLDDAPSGTGDNSFAGGTKENDTTVNLVTGSIPNKDDLLRAYAASETTNGSSYLYLSWARLVSNGDAHIDFELNKDGTTDWSGSAVTIKRSVGDLLVSYDFVGNLNQVTITAFTWDGSAWSNPKDLTALGEAEGAVNVKSAITDEIEGGTLDAGNFGEAAINLTAELGLPADQPCATFGSLFAKTRSSGSGGTAQLKDLVLPVPIHVSTCGSIELKKHWVGPTGSTTLKIGKTPGGSEVTSKTVTSDDTTGAQQVPQADYYVGESALPNYTSSLACFNDLNGNGSEDGGETVTPGADGKVTVHTNDAVVCTLTNTFNKLTPTVATTLKNGATDATVANGSHLPLNSGVYDTAQISAAGGYPLSGTVTFNFYASGDCTGTPAAQTGATVSGSSAQSSSHLNLGAGSYSFNAQYAAGSDNAHNDSAVSACEPFVIDKAQLTIGTTIHNASHGTIANGSSIALGSIVHDTAQVGGTVGGFTPSGAVTFTIYPNLLCTVGTGTSIATSGTTEANGNQRTVDTSSLAAGDYAFRASVAGDSNYAGDTSACEPFTVNKAQLTVGTTIHDANHNPVANGSHVALGSAMHDTAQVGGAVGGFAPTGAVSFTVYPNLLCTAGTGTPIATSGTDANGDPRSAATSALAAGDYAFKATVAGDANYVGQTSACEPFTVNKAQLTLGTTIHDATHTAVTSVPLGSSVHDTAQVGGTVGGFTPSGAVSFTFYPNDSCTPGSGSPIATSGTEANGDPRTVATSALAVGGYSFKAMVAGDSNYLGQTSDCEPLSVGKASSSTVTHIHNAANDAVVTSVALGTSVYDSATVTSANTQFKPTGTVTFTFYTSADCTIGGGAAGSHAVDASTGVASPSSTEGPLAAGSYSFKASYGGDDNFAPSVGDCEPLTVTKAGSSTATDIHNAAGDAVVTSIALGGSVYDSAKVTSANTSFKPTGTVTFNFYTSADCSTGGSAAGGHSVDASTGIASPSSTEGPLAAGSYSFKASYAGDANFNPSDGLCEPLAVNKADTSAVTQIHNAAGGAVVTSIALGGSVYDSATVSSSNASFKPSGTVSFTFYSSLDCSTGGAAAGSHAVDAATGVASPSSTEGPLGAGSYSFKASYGGDANFNASVGACEPLTVNKAQLAVSTKVHDADHNDITNGIVRLGSVVHDVSFVTGGVTGLAPSGGVSFVLYSTSNCQGLALPVMTDGTENGNVRSADSMTLVPGNYGFVATVAGDANYLGATGACEPFSVVQAAIAITKNPAAQSVSSGGTANFTITVTNTGSVTLTNVTVSDPLSIGCSKSIGTLTAGQSTTYTCTQGNVTAPYTNVATATGHPPVGPDVTASASARVEITQTPPPSSPTPPPTVVDLAIVKTANPTSVVKGNNVTYTLTVTNNGPVTDTSVQVGDSLPFGVTYVSATSSQGTCSGTTVVQCAIGTMTNGQQVTITLVVNTTNTGLITNTATVVGALPETTLSNNTSSTTINVTAPPAPKPAPAPKPRPKPKAVFKPPVVKPKPKPVPPPPCYAVVVAPKQLTVGKHGTLRLVVTAKNKPIAGVKIEVKGAGVLKLSNRTDRTGHVNIHLQPKKAGIVLVKPASYKGCANPRVGVIAAFTPPVTG